MAIPTATSVARDSVLVLARIPPRVAHRPSSAAGVELASRSTLGGSMGAASRSCTPEVTPPRRPVATMASVMSARRAVASQQHSPGLGPPTLDGVGRRRRTLSAPTASNHREARSRSPRPRPNGQPGSATASPPTAPHPAASPRAPRGAVDPGRSRGTRGREEGMPEEQERRGLLKLSAARTLGRRARGDPVAHGVSVELSPVSTTPAPGS
jgi:hypothetical protein